MSMVDCLPQIDPVKKESVLRGDNALANADAPLLFSGLMSAYLYIIISLHQYVLYIYYTHALYIHTLYICTLYTNININMLLVVINIKLIVIFKKI